MSYAALIKPDRGFSQHPCEDILSRASTRNGEEKTEFLLLGPEETPDHNPGCLEVCGVTDTVQTT